MRVVILTLVVCSFLFASPYKSIPLLYDNGNIVSQAFNGGGAAMFKGPSGQVSNPAMPAVWHRIYKQKGFVDASFLRTDAQEWSIAASLNMDQKGVGGAHFRYAKDSLTHEDYFTGGMSIAKPVAKSGSDELFLGFPLNYAFHEYGAENSEHTAYADVSFFQLDVESGMTFTVVAENILGYRWLSNTVALPLEGGIDSTEIREHRKWLPGGLKSILVASASKIPLEGTSMTVTVPVDIRFWGFLDGDLRDRSKLKERVELYSGLELFRGNKKRGDGFAARVGYAWKDPNYRTDEAGKITFTPDHQFSFGFAIGFQRMLVDIAFVEEGFGVSGTIGF